MVGGCMPKSSNRFAMSSVRTLDIAKRLLDFGMHPPTIYFPLIVEECLMIEPTESESLETLDEFADIMLKIAEEVETNPEYVQSAPHRTLIGRLDEVTAARSPVLRYEFNSNHDCGDLAESKLGLQDKVLATHGSASR